MTEIRIKIGHEPPACSTQIRGIYINNVSWIRRNPNSRLGPAAAAPHPAHPLPYGSLHHCWVQARFWMCEVFFGLVHGRMISRKTLARWSASRALGHFKLGFCKIFSVRWEIFRYSLELVGHRAHSDSIKLGTECQKFESLHRLRWTRNFSKTIHQRDQINRTAVPSIGMPARCRYSRVAVSRTSLSNGCIWWAIVVIHHLLN